MIDMNKKVTGIRLSTHADFETPISMDEFKEYFDEFMVKTDEVCHDVFNENCPKGCYGVGYPTYENGEKENYIHIRECLRELEKVFNVLDTSNRDLTDDEQHIIDNFPYTFAQAITCDIYPDACKQIINHLVSMTDDNDWFDEYVKVVRCGCCKWWKDSRCTNVNGAYNNTIFNPDWFCRSGTSIMEDD